MPDIGIIDWANKSSKAVKAKAPVEQVTYSIDPTATGGTLRIEWGTTSVTSPFTVGK